MWVLVSLSEENEMSELIETGVVRVCVVSGRFRALPVCHRADRWIRTPAVPQ